MKIIERPGLWTPYDHSKVTLATFDERGRICDKVESDNYITDYLTYFFQWWARGFISKRCGITSPNTDTNSGSSAIEWAIPGGNTLGQAFAPGVQNDPIPTAIAGNAVGFPPQTVVLTTASHAEDPTNDRYVRGGVTAWSPLEQIVGTDPKRGGINPTECLVTNTKAVFVFDWPTSAGNGSIQTVYWTYISWSANAYNFNNDMYIQNANNTGYSSSGTPTWVASQSTGFTYYNSSHDIGTWLDPDGVSYWTLLYNQITTDSHMVKRTLGTGAFVSSLRLQGSGTGVVGFANDGTSSVGNWWTYDGSGNLRKFPAAGGTATASFTAAGIGMALPYFPFTGDSNPMFMQGGFLWLASSPNGGPYRMYQLGNLTTTPTVAASVTIPTPGSNFQPAQGNFSGGCGLYYVDAANGDELWLNSNGVISRFDLNGNWRGSFDPAPGQQITGMSLYPGGGIILTNSVYQGSPVPVITNHWIVNNCRQFHARSLLPATVTKANTQTMKLTYEFDFS